MYRKTVGGISVLVLVLTAWQAQAQRILVSWEYDPGYAVTQWKLLMVRSANQATEQTQVALVPREAAQCSHDITTLTQDAYVPGQTWCAFLPCPGDGAYAFVLQAVVGEAESGPSNVLTVGINAACQLIPYDTAVGAALATPASGDAEAGGLPGPPSVVPGAPVVVPETPHSPPVVPVPVETPSAVPAAVPVLVETPETLATVHEKGDALLARYEKELTTIAREYQNTLATTVPARQGKARTHAMARQETLYKETLAAWQVLLHEWERVRRGQEEAGTAREQAKAPGRTPANPPLLPVVSVVPVVPVVPVAETQTLEPQSLSQPDAAPTRPHRRAHRRHRRRPHAERAQTNHTPAQH